MKESKMTDEYMRVEDSGFCIDSDFMTRHLRRIT